ncbi:Lpg1974 family pore-forming outer membrane protein [Pseudohoeflea coraliihabitans]|uniref:Outer membrane protein beta-barrel domain-containing protein n=1 Tax=Pseudohoeflea coraliihabitans TaxID=2860393 RepID=A0ABS6WRR9_9HYPH|nr:Lpg1974 family pore-forming outer membrane protein [Pseudohoeflea sp. DP4N28-3]MBW3098343.1 hypothetical protein [Pseudohoeflea sp. DP4N28-3]
MRPVKTRLLSTISGLALAAVVSGPALAADAVDYVAAPTGIEVAPSATSAWVSLEGRYNIHANGPFDGNGLLGYYFADLDPSPDDGWGGSIELGVKPAGMDYDFVGRFTYMQSEGNSSYFYSYGPYYGDFEAEVDQKLMLADFEVGRELGVGTRVHAGLRFAHYDGSLRAGGDYYNPAYYGGGFAAGNASFTGIGPRIGIEHRFGLTDSLSLDLAAAGAAIYGKREADIFAYNYSSTSGPGVFAAATSENEWVLNAEASAGLTYSFNPSSSITAGYRIDYFSDIATDFLTGQAADHYTHGPFLKATFRFGG